MAAKDVPSSWYAPNQQAVGVNPARSDGKGSVSRTAEAPATAEGDTYDPGAGTIDDVKAYVEANPDQRDAVLKAEKAGKNRSTLVDWFNG